MAAAQELKSVGAIPHALAIAGPVQSHVNTLMRFCRALASHNILITVVHFEPFLERISSTANRRHPVVDQPFPAIRTTSIPLAGFDLKNDYSFSFESAMIALEKIGDDLLQVVTRLAKEGPPVTCIISDINLSVAPQEVADKLSLPRFALFHSSQSYNLFLYHLSKGVIPLADVLHATRENNTGLFRDDIPGLPRMRNSDVPHFRRQWDETEFTYDYLIRQTKTSATRGAIFVVNSFQELENPAMEVMSKDVPVYLVGPLLEQDETNLWKEDDRCIQWLDKQPARSVLYIAFGSIVTLSEKQFDELLLGLEASNQRFLWVRPDFLTDGACSKLLDGFRIRTKDRGYTVSWAPQTRVLGHASVGGFMTHCGWNSVLEALENKVPMICVPSFGDQLAVCQSMVELWKVGMRPETDKEGIVGKTELERVIRAVMEGEEGKLLTANTAKLREAGHRSLEKGGPSFLHMQAIVQIIKGLP